MTRVRRVALFIPARPKQSMMTSAEDIMLVSISYRITERISISVGVREAFILLIWLLS